MNILFEEEGAFKAGSVLLEQETSLQVEMPSGKRVKLKAAQVLLRFAAPAPGRLLEEAGQLAAQMDVEFLWDVAGEGEFFFLDLAREYFGGEPEAAQATSLLLALHAAPVYFHRRGKGRFRKAPAEILQAALAALRRKEEQALAIGRWVAALKNGELPTELAPYAESLLAKPDRNRPEIKAFEAAAAELACGMPELLLRVGALKSPYEVHLRRFLLEQFPRGIAFTPVETPPWPDDLPEADVSAFSIDDAATTEVDDAFSVTPLPDGGFRVGIHIAAPGLAIKPGSPLDAIARARLSTVYLPGDKFTMLPEAAIAAYTLEGGRSCPALSLYFTLDAQLGILAHESRVERVQIAANLRHHELESWFNAETLAAGLPEAPFRDELLLLWRFAKTCETRRGKPPATQEFTDYDFSILGDLADPDACRVEIRARPRGSPLDKLVAELMILANTTWGGLLAERHVACLYRAQTGGKTRMSAAPQPHEGLGVPQYAWMTSPLRRYCDLLNQWQLIACLADETPPFAPRSAALFAALRDFELTYAAYADFQRALERYWSLFWLRQEGIQRIAATVRRDDLVRLEGLPLFTRIPGLAEAASGERVLLQVEGLDFLGLEVRCRLLEVLSRTTPAGETAGIQDEA
jgi:exoribonuclease-2